VGFSSINRADTSIIEAQAVQEKEQVDEQAKAQIEAEKEAKRVRTRPKMIEKYKGMISGFKTAEALDKWRVGSQDEIERDLPKESDQAEVYAYAEEIYQGLASNDTPEEEPEEVGQIALITCPNSGDGVHPDYCKTNWTSFDGCPMFEE
jgi:hypothetical protein